ncbi:LLM class flavin-dependent oxidoreductase [Streptomyces sp. NBC_00287]|uniref:LLM class flavin-dependent oxidoreductase n=1 Tax=Streptomyces sp. NBC_00287 TaxID=2975702 RepID=UPI002E29B865|nr:LLM class flavin-dependent oxidoreductase [Streptomyces sp. NBC_00287]
MRIGMPLSYSGGFKETVDELRDYEKAGLDVVFVPEAYSFDAISQLGFIAAHTDRLEIASGILQIYTRTPTLTAMTAVGLDYRLRRSVHPGHRRLGAPGDRGFPWAAVHRSPGPHP